MGLYQIDSTTAESIFSMLKDAILRLQLCISKNRGQSYDGAGKIKALLAHKIFLAHH